jgi:cytochrome c
MRSLLLSALLLGVSAAPALAAGDAVKGKAVFRKCMTCHSLDPKRNMTGPSLAGIMGKQIATNATFRYSPDYKKATFKWDAAKMDAYLQGPKKMFPSSRMVFVLPNPKDRADLIAYLQTNPKP